MGKNAFTYQPGYNGSLEARMSKKTNKRSHDDCWPWTGSLDTSGYGCIRVDGKLRRATHVAYELYHGVKIQIGMEILHSCDNPACVNPHHLSLGTKTLNMQDKIAKGRDNSPKGASHPMAKLTWEQVQQIRKTFEHGGHTFTSLAAIYGINRSTASRIVKGKLWIQNSS